MLRSVDDWEGEHFAFGGAPAPQQPSSVAIDNGADGPTATIPDAHLLFTAQFARAGDNLLLHGEDGRSFVVQDYFATDDRARLLSPEGAALSPDVIAALAGPQAPGQYAQAAATPSAAQAVGRVVQSGGDATIVRNGVAIVANTGDAILKGDVLQTASGSLGVTFNDGSTLNLTANTRLVVNEFVYDPRGSANSQLLDLVQGSLTFISGEIAHTGNMSIGTPVATMGIRGTVGGVTTATDGTVNFYVSQSATGAVILDSRGTIIANVVQDGPLIIVRPVGLLQVLAEEVSKSPAQLAIELAALQQIVSIQSIGQQIIQQYFQTDPNNNPNPNPQSTDRPLTQIQLSIQLNQSSSSGDGGNDDGDATSPATATVVVTTITPEGIEVPTSDDPIIIDIPDDQPPLISGPLQLATDEDAALVFSVANENSISLFDSDTGILTVTLTASHGVLTLSGVAGLTFSAGDGTADATMSFSGTQAAINDALDGMSFMPDPDYNGEASISITSSDGTSTTATNTIPITVGAVNDAPVIAQPNSPMMSYTEGQSATSIDAVLALSDIDSATLSGATVTISGNFQVGADVLSFANQNDIVGSYDAQTGVLTLLGVASVAAYQAALQSVAYANSSENPSDETRTISYQVDDGGAANNLSNVVTATIDVTPVNDPPALDYFNVTVAEGGVTVLSSDDFQVTDPDSTEFTFTVQNVTGGQFEVSGGDPQYFFAAFEGPTVVTFTSDDIANERVSFVHDGGEAPPSFTITVSDGVNESAAVTETGEVNPVNDTPTISSLPGELSINEDGGIRFEGANAIAVHDSDTEVLTVTLTASHGVLTMNSVAGLTFTNGDGSSAAAMTFSGSQAAINAALGGLSFNPYEHYNGTASLEIEVNDGQSTTIETVAISVNSVNDAPVIALLAISPVNYIENQPPAAICPAMTLSDVDSDTLAGATVMIVTTWSVEDILSFTSPSGSGIVGTYANGVLTLSGAATVAEYQAALRSVSYSNSGDNPTASMHTISFRVDDGSGTNGLSHIAHASVDVAPVNDVPVLRSFKLTVSEGGTTVLTRDDFEITDPDSSSHFFSVTNVLGGQFQVSNGENWVSAPTGGFTVDDIEADNVRFVHDGGEAAPTFTVWASDGMEDGAGAPIIPTVVFTNVNDAPVITSGSSGAPDQFQQATSTGLALGSTGAVRGLATDGLFLYVNDAGAEIDIYTLAGSFVASHSVDNLAGGSNQMTFADGHLYARNSDTIYLVSTQDWSSTAVSVPEDRPLLTSRDWMSGDLLSLPDGRVGVLGADNEATTTLRLYTVGANGTSLTWSEDRVLQTAGLPADNHGSASDGTYIYIADYGINGYRSYSLATGELAYSSGDITDSGTGADLYNPTFLTHDHVNGEYIFGSYETPAVLLSVGYSNGFSVAENTTAVTTVTASDVDAGTTLTYSIVGGADSALFSINPSTGVLTFIAAPDYEAPADQGADNVYDVTVQVSDGALTDTQAIAVTLTNLNEAPVLTLSHSEYVEDRFNSIAYNLNTGSVNWTSAWSEANDTNSAATGEIRVATDRDVNLASGDYRLLLSDNDGEAGAPDTVQREADLTGAISATLSFDYRRDLPNGTSNDLFRVYMSDDGADFTQIGTIGGGTVVDGAYSTISFGITSYISAHTTVRFSVGDEVNNDGSQVFDIVYIDNIQISYGLPATNYTINYVENGAGVLISAGGNIITDNDNATLQSATIALANHQPGDLLTVNGSLPSSITPSTYNSLTGVLTLTGAATLADYAAALHQVQFHNTDDNPGDVDRTLHVTVFDGADNSNTVDVTVHVTPVNDAPEAQDDYLIFAAGNIFGIEGQSFVEFPFDFLAVNDDPDGGDVFTSAFNEVNDAFSVTALPGANVSLGSGGVLYQLVANQSLPFSDSFTYDISNDGQGNGTEQPATVSLSVVNGTTLTGGATDDILVGSAQNETLTGGAGVDGFVFMPGLGNDTVTDFTPGVDKIVLAYFDGLSASQLSPEELAFLANPTEGNLDAWKDLWIDGDDTVTFALTMNGQQPVDILTIATTTPLGQQTLLDSLHVNDFIVYNMPS